MRPRVQDDAVTQGCTPPPSSHGSCKPIDEYLNALRGYAAVEMTLILVYPLPTGSPVLLPPAGSPLGHGKYKCKYRIYLHLAPIIIYKLFSVLGFCMATCSYNYHLAHRYASLPKCVNPCMLSSCHCIILYVNEAILCGPSVASQTLCSLPKIP